MTGSVEHWTRRLQPLLAGGRVHVVAETGSTQDTARQLAAGPGDVITTLRQTAGRGRHGRAWADTAGDGLALSIVTDPSMPAASARLAIACAVGAARAVESVGVAPVGIKWPNDLMVDDRKLGGILVEQDDRVAVIGIGINIRQASWPADLVGRAVSLRERGCPASRLDVAAALVTELPAALGLARETLLEAFEVRDVLRGRHAVVRSGDRRVSGRIVRIDPMETLVVAVGDGEESIPAATATIESFQ